MKSENNLSNIRVVNGFRLIPVEVFRINEIPYFLWSVRPNKSDRLFYFSKLSSAEHFCLLYKNNHTNKFWFRLWNNNPLYHKEQCLKNGIDILICYE